MTNSSKKNRTAPVSLPVNPFSGLISYPRKKAFSKASKIVERVEDALGHFYNLYNSSGRSGSPTHKEQDLLRSMLLFSGSGLDVFLKQLINDTLPIAIEKDEGSRREFVKYVERRIKNKNYQRSTLQTENREENHGRDNFDYAFIAEILGSSEPRAYLLAEYVNSFSNSLQSSDEVLRIAAAFALSSNDVLNTQGLDELKKYFVERNKIAHEMDICFKSKGWNTTKRQGTTTEEQCKSILRIMGNFLSAIDRKI